ncbi:MAG: autotransporter assembly complex protein TamA [Steroidobacteraceae bacterium]
MRRILLLGCVLAMGVYGAPVVRAADPQSYRVDIASTGNGAMDATLRAASDLFSLRSSAPVSPLGLIARARADTDRLKTVLESNGYYQSSIALQIDGMALNDPALVDSLTALPKNRDARVTVAFDLGPLYHLGRITVDGELPPAARDALPLKPGAPAVAASVLGAGAQLRSVLEEDGFAFAKVDPPVAYEDQTAPRLDITFHVEAGPRVNIGDIRLEGLHRLHEKLIRRRLLLKTGEQFRASAVERARQDLLSLGIFAAVTVQVGSAVDDTGGVPITFQFRERPRHAVNLNAAYSSDLGGSAGATWSDRDVFGNAERLTISATLIDVGGSSTTGLGYDTSAKFIVPDFGHRDQSLQVAVGAVKQFLQAYDQTAVTSGVTLTRKLSKFWTVSAGVTATEEQIIQDQPFICVIPPLSPATTCAASQVNEVISNPVTHDYTLVALPLTLSLDSTDLRSPLDDPTHGMRDSASVAPTRSLGLTSATFIISQVKLAGYFDLDHLLPTDPGRSVLAARALVGLAQGAGQYSLPPDQRFYGGGSGTFRGYPYQAASPLIPYTNDPLGGTAITAGSLEYRQRFGQHFGAAFFVDGGQVSDKLKVVPSSLYVGVGAGIRYYTPIGPVRLDVAVPTKHYSTDDQAFQVYFGLGQAF